MFKVTFAFENGSEVEAFANAGDNLLEVARGANVAIDAPCSGNGACGKCRVQLKGKAKEGQQLAIYAGGAGVCCIIGGIIWRVLLYSAAMHIFALF